MEINKDLTKAEWMVMNRVWEHKKVTAREVTEDLFERTGWSYNTVKTMLVRLVEKGVAREKKVGGTCFYFPEVPKKKAITHALDDIFDRILDGTFEPLVSYLGKTQRLKKSDLEALEKLLEQHKND